MSIAAAPQAIRSRLDAIATAAAAATAAEALDGGAADEPGPRGR
jgi:hypothetical protein